MLTAEQIRDRLGLIDPDHFETQARFRNQVKIGEGKLRPKDLYRGTGRSTRQMVKALVLIQEGEPVWFVARRPHQAILTCTACQTLARRLKLDHTLVRSGPYTPEFLSDKPLARVFPDVSA